MTERFSSSALGFVCIVGAGPGPMDLMTLRALNRLRNADVVVHDRLVSTDVLDQIPPKAQRIYVGKALGDHAVPQEGIHALLVAHARRGSRVVRLKGGDPYVFGRGGEEVQSCRQLCVFARPFGARRCHPRLAGSGPARTDACFLHGRAASGANCRSSVQPWVGAAIVRDGTRPTQTVIACSLQRLVQMATAYGTQPGLLIIGETVRMSPFHHAD